MNVDYKISYDNDCDSQENSEQIEEIIVEQQIGVVWEARVKISIEVDEQGVWRGIEDPTRSEFKRMRIEVSAGEEGSKSVPLIDGRIIARDIKKSGSPGESELSLVVHDDSTLLNAKEEILLHGAESDSEIARAIFAEANLGGDIQIDDTSARPDPDLPILQSGTKMQILRFLAKQNGDFYAYVLPGETAGESIGCFKKLPTDPDEDLPTLYLLGENRNLAEFNIRQNSLSASKFVGASLSLRDKSLQNAASSYDEAEILGDEVSTNASGDNERIRRLPTGHNGTVDLSEAVSGRAATSGYTLIADGSVLPQRFQGVLSPYRVIPVRLSDSRFSTNYLIYKVVHTLTPSSYTQSFTMKGNAVSASAGSDGSLPQANADVSAGLNIQVNIF